jgi:DNA-binding transcriptional MerR regulator/effector-binding domain-containing protein
MSSHLSIGDFSRATHLSVKTLHHYHDVGLVEPDHVDPSSGYRYYSHTQIPTAQVVRRLRELDMPIPDIKAVLVAVPEIRNQLIATHLDRLETELANTRVAVNALRLILSRPDDSAAIEHRTMPAASAIAIHEVVNREDLLVWWQGALGELHATVDAARLRQAGVTGGLYAGDIFQHDCGHATVFIPIEGEVRRIGRVRPITVPPAELAVMRHYGALDDIDVTYGALGSYAARHKISVDGPLREYYVCDAWDTADASRWETDVGWPVFRADRDA